MRRKWYKYVLSTAVVACSIYTQGLINDTFAQQTAQPAEESGSNLEDLKWQLQLMEESAARQQEQIQAIKERLDVVGSKTQISMRRIPRILPFAAQEFIWVATSIASMYIIMLKPISITIVSV